MKLGRIVLNPTTDLPPERWAKDIEVQVSTDSAEGPYQPVAQLTLRQKAEPQGFDILPVEARFVRLQFRSNYGSRTAPFRWAKSRFTRPSTTPTRWAA